MIEYRKLGRQEINRELFRDFVRRQEVTDCWRKENSVWVVRKDPFIDDWSEEDYTILADCLKHTVSSGGFVYAAFCGGSLKGFVSVEPELFGGGHKYLDLSSIHVSADMRGHGIGRVLFDAAKEWAVERGAAKLYISAHSAVESQAFYKAMGCVEAQQYDLGHVEKEPYDCQLGYVLAGTGHGDFDYKRVAEGYKRRPFLHKQVIDAFRKDMAGQTFSYGLDVGCGAGLSSKALQLICSHVTGADSSAEMVAAAREVCGGGQEYDFLVCKAEEIPEGREKYDIVTAAGVIQWVERGKFLRNLRNVMDADGYLLIYDFCLSDRMKGNEAYSLWWHDIYLKEFPKPYRNEHVWTEEDVEPYGFSMLRQEEYEMEYEFSLDSFLDFMMIQSNVNVKVEKEKRDVNMVREWFRQSLEPVFRHERETAVFTGYRWYIQKKG